MYGSAISIRGLTFLPYFGDKKMHGLRIIKSITSGLRVKEGQLLDTSGFACSDLVIIWELIIFNNVLGFIMNFC